MSLARHRTRLGFHFVVRSGGDTHVEAEGWRGALSDLPLPRGRLRDMDRVRSTVEHPEDVRLVALFDRGPKVAWVPFPDLNLPARKVVHLYGPRFPIEEVFRDQKSTRYGWSLGEDSLEDRPDRLDRLILVVACGYFLVFLIGHPIERKGLDRLYEANTVRTRSHSAFQMGWKGHALVRWLPLVWLRHLATLVFDLDFTELRRPEVPHATPHDTSKCARKTSGAIPRVPWDWMPYCEPCVATQRNPGWTSSARSTTRRCRGTSSS